MRTCRHKHEFMPMWKGVCFFWIFGPKPPKNLVVYVWKVNRSGFWKVVQVENVRSWKIYVWRGGWVYALYIAEDVLLLCFRKQEFFPFLLGSPFNTWFFLVLVRIRQAASAISFTYFGSMRNGICTSWMFQLYKLVYERMCDLGIPILLPNLFMVPIHQFLYLVYSI